MLYNALTTLSRIPSRVVSSAVWRSRLGVLFVVTLAHWLALGGLPRALHGPWGWGNASIRTTTTTRSTFYVNLGSLRTPRAGPPIAANTAALQNPQGSPPAEDATSDAGEPSDEAPFGIAGMLDEDKPILMATPAATQLQYDILREVNGRRETLQGELLWQHDGRNYTSRMDIGDLWRGSRPQTSEGRLTENGLEPLRFEDKVFNPVAVQFDREAGKLRFGGNAPEADLTLGAQDQLSIWIQLATIFSGNADRLPLGSTLAFQTAGATAPVRWAFTVGETTLLTTSTAPPMKAIRLTRDPVVGGDDTRLEVWLAPDIGFMPLRIRLSNSNGDFVDQLWRAGAKPWRPLG